MNVEAYTLDSLRDLVRELQKENRHLRKLLYEKDTSVPEVAVFENHSLEPDEYDPDQGGRIIPFQIDGDVANKFLSRFWGRLDVYAKRGRNGGYYPQCKNRWDPVCPKQNNPKFFCDDCPNKNWKALHKGAVIEHLRGTKEDGSDAIGVYPLFPDNTCRFLVFDFDNHEKGSEYSDFANKDDVWKDEVESLRKICHMNHIPALVERSRSGRGAHVWFFFRQPVQASLARNFGFALLDRGAAAINLTSFRFYDRMYPSQDATSSLGNLIALPLQGQPLKLGNSAFVDESWNAYPDQLEILEKTPGISLQQINEFLTNWSLEQAGQVMVPGALLSKERLKPWKKNDHFQNSDVTGTFHLVLADGVYVDALNLSPRLQNQIRCMATIDNPEFYANLRSGRSNYYHFSTIYLGKDMEGYIRIPRGLQEKIIDKCKESGIPYDIDDQRQTGRPIRVKFNGELRPAQQQAVQSMLKYDTGVLSAATGSGKTIMCCYLIAQRKANTLILVNNVDLVRQWEEELTRFLNIDEPLPAYKTPGGKVKYRTSIIGKLSAGQNKMGGIIDIAMVGSAYKKGAFFDGIDSYGMVIMDECHHAASAQAQAVLQKVHSKYVYGVSATPVRSDQLEKINYMLLGPVRYEYTAKEQATAQGISLYVRPRFTRVVDLKEHKNDFHAAMDLICESQDRTDQILSDAKECIRQGRTPVILTGRKKHAKQLFDSLLHAADHVFLMYGDNSANKNDQIRKEMQQVKDQDSLILVATGQKIGEGFNYPRLDTLMLASPVKFDGRLTQYAGRLSRPYSGKNNVIVYDYVDSHIRIFDNQYKNRLTAYKRLGYKVLSEDSPEKQTVHAIFDKGNYMETFERDLVEADLEIVISSPQLMRYKIDRLLSLMRTRQEAGVSITVITTDPEAALFDNTIEKLQLIAEMKSAGIIVQTTGSETEHFAVIDKKLVWHGGMNLLGKEDAWDNLIRIENHKAAAELLEIAFQDVVRRKGEA